MTTAIMDSTELVQLIKSAFQLENYLRNKKIAVKVISEKNQVFIEGMVESFYIKQIATLTVVKILKNLGINLEIFNRLDVAN